VYGKATNQCDFDSVSRCGYHNDLDKTSDLLFLSEATAHTVVTAAAPHDNVFRRLSEHASLSAEVTSIIDVPSLSKVNHRVEQTNAIELLASRIERLDDQQLKISVADILDEMGWTSAGQLLIWSTEVRWETNGPFLAARIGGATSLERAENTYRVTMWRNVLRSAFVRVSMEHSFVGRAQLWASLQVQHEGEAVMITRRYDVVVNEARRLAFEDETIVHQMSTSQYEPFEDPTEYAEDQRKFDLTRKKQTSRRLSWLSYEDTTAIKSTPIWSAQAPPLFLETTEDSNLTFSIAGVLPWYGVEKSWCRTTIYLFTEEKALVGLTSAADDAVYLTEDTSQTTEHTCNDSIVMHRVTKSKNTVFVLLEVEVAASFRSPKAGLILLPLEWGAVSSLVAAPSASIFAAGSIDVPAGRSMVLNASFAFAPGSSSIEIGVDPCRNLQVSVLLPLAVPMLLIDPDECSTTLLGDLVERLSNHPLVLQISQMNPSTSTVPTKVTVSVEARNGSMDDRLDWASTKQATASQIIRFCPLLAQGNSGVLYFKEGEANTLDLTRLLAAVTSPSNIKELFVDSISFIWSTSSADGVGSFNKDDSDLVPEQFNLTAQIVTLDCVSGSNFSYTPFTSGSYRMDLLLQVVDTTQNTSDCRFISSVLIVVVPVAGSPTFAVPFMFSRTLVQGSSAHMSIPIARTMNPARLEYLSLALSANTTEYLQVEYAGLMQSVEVMDGWHYVVIDWSKEISQAREVVLIVTPPDSFSGTLTFGIEVSVIDTADERLDIADFTTEYTVVEQVDVKWLRSSDLTVKMPYAGQAVYRSPSILLNGDSVFKFSYRMRSGMMTISLRCSSNVW
jgi:hypothetical protein